MTPVVFHSIKNMDLFGEMQDMQEMRHPPSPFLPFTPRRFPDNARRTRIWPIPRGPIMRKINRARPKSNQCWGWSGYISMQDFRPFHPCIFQEMPGNLSGRTGEQAEKRLRLVGWTDGPMYRWNRVSRTDERTDEQPENTMPPVPKCGDIKSQRRWRWYKH